MSLTPEAHDPFLAAIDGATDLAPTAGQGTAAAVPVTIGGIVYQGMGRVPLEALALCTAEEYGAMRPAQRAHRSRRLLAAASDPRYSKSPDFGKFGAAQVQALREKGILPRA
ncbi:MAG: hypothetical protein ACJ768_11610 [Gaiellaceae bacterium]